MSDPQLDILRAESAAVRLGPEWLAEIRQACAEVSHRFDPAVYGVAEATWSASELEDLVQDVTVEHLLRQGQLDYILDVADTIGDVRRLVRHQVRRALVRRRRLTVIDRLIGRISATLREEYESVPGVTPIRYRPPGTDLTPVPPTDAGLRRASAAVRLLPTSAAAGDRAPAVFRSEVLDIVVAKSFEAAQTSLSLADFDRILSNALTSWVPVVLELTEDVLVEAPDELGPALEQTATMIIDDLNEEARLVLRTKLSGASDSELASRLGVTRPTAAKRKTEAFAALRDSWTSSAPDATSMEQSHLAQLLYLQLLKEGGDE